MRNPDLVLDNLSFKSKDETYVFTRLYRNLYNPEFYYKAYAKIASNEGNMTAGTDGNTIDGMSKGRINRLIEVIKDVTYKPMPSRRVYIPKRNGNKRPLGIPSIDDKLVQEIVKNILESIYEGSFSNKSHGFRPKRSCHTAIDQINKTFKGTKWFIEGDIKGFFDNIDHHILIGLLRKRIKDERFIQLIWKMLKAGYLEEWKYFNSYSGTPQGGIISPLLSNIYLHELDSFIGKYKETFDKGAKRKINRQYNALRIRQHRLQKKLENIDLSETGKAELIKEIKSIQKEKRTIPCSEPMDENYKRIQYVRYADDFLIGIIGNKKDAIKVKQDLMEFLASHLNLELSAEKTLITHSSENAKFLGFNVRISRSNMAKKVNGIVKRTLISVPTITVPKEAWLHNLINKGAIRINGSQWKPEHRSYLLKHSDLEILEIYNAEIRGLYNYYRIAIDVSTLSKYKYFMEYSMYKTFASKYRSTILKVRKKFSLNGRFCIKYKTKNGDKVRFFYDDGFKRLTNSTQDSKVDQIPNTIIYGGRTSLEQRLLADICEWCGKSNVPLEVHHIRKLKDLKGKKNWEQVMIARKRKTMVLCVKCHHDLHNGRLD